MSDGVGYVPRVGDSVTYYFTPRDGTLRHSCDGLVIEVGPLGAVVIAEDDTHELRISYSERDLELVAPNTVARRLVELSRRVNDLTRQLDDALDDVAALRRDLAEVERDR